MNAYPPTSSHTDLPVEVQVVPPTGLPMTMQTECPVVPVTDRPRALEDPAVQALQERAHKIAEDEKPSKQKNGQKTAK